MDGITVLGITGIILITLGLPIVYWRIGRLSSKLSVEVIACKHSLRDDGGAFLLWTEHRLYNNGNKKTTVTSLEAHLVDAENNFQSQTLTLNIEVGARANTNSKVLFSFAPPFPYTQNLKIHFILNHTHGREVFVADSTQSDLQKLL